MKNQYIKPLDSLRAIAALFVVFFHYNDVYLQKTTTGTFAYFYYTLLSFGWLGVDLFFVLSGFLITRILIWQRGETSFFKRFYARRALRIFPVYYFVLFSYFVVPNLLGKSLFASEVTASNQIWLWTYLTNIPYPTMQFGDLGHFWSLAVEEHFYLFWPFIVYNYSDKKIVKICCSIIGGVFFLRYFLYFYGIDIGYIKFSTFCRIDTILFGCLLGVFSLKSNFLQNLEKLNKVKKLCFAIILFYIATVGYTRLGKINIFKDLFLISMYPVFAIFFACIIAQVSFSKKKDLLIKFLDNHLLRSIGKISYGIYIFHLPAQRIASVLQTRFLPFVPQYHDYFGVQFLWIIFQLSLTLLISFLSWHLLEKIFINLKSKYEFTR